MRYALTLPNIDYGSDEVPQYPCLSNRYTPGLLPDKFHRWGTHLDRPFHCFVDDWRIEAIWRHKHKMSDRVLLSHIGVLPDYTVETDTPLVHAIHQVWRSRTIGRYWQDQGFYCVPALQWSRPSINSYLFAGLDQCEVVAVRSPSNGRVDSWIHCAEQFLQIHSPKLVLHFGTKKGIDVWPNAVNLNLR